MKVIFIALAATFTMLTCAAQVIKTPRSVARINTEKDFTASISGDTIITCTSEVVDNGSYKPVTICDSVAYPQVCIDTVKETYDSCYFVKKRFLFWSWLTTECKYDAVRYTYYPRQCVVKKWECNTVQEWVPDLDTIVTCDTTLPEIIKPAFGAKLQGRIDEQVAALKSMGAAWVRTGLIISAFNGADKSLETYLDNGFKVALNLTYNATKPAPFYKDLVNYEKKLREIFTKYGARLAASGSILLCENEPSNDGYYGTAPIADYLKLLEVLTRVAHEYNIKVADGCTFIEYLYLITQGSYPDRYEANVQQQKEIIAGLRTIPVDYVNVHLAVHDDTITPGMIKAACDYLWANTGKPVITNEYHYENCTAGSGIVEQTINEWIKAGVQVCIVWSGDGAGSGGNSPADALSIGSTLTKLGEDQRDAIKNKVQVSDTTVDATTLQSLLHNAFRIYSLIVLSNFEH